MPPRALVANTPVDENLATRLRSLWTALTREAALPSRLLMVISVFTRKGRLAINTLFLLCKIPSCGDFGFVASVPQHV
jgi:hypothetical protein